MRIKLRFTIAPPNKTTNVGFYGKKQRFDHNFFSFKDNTCLLFRHYRNEVAF